MTPFIVVCLFVNCDDMQADVCIYIYIYTDQRLIFTVMTPE